MLFVRKNSPGNRGGESDSTAKYTPLKGSTGSSNLRTLGEIRLRIDGWMLTAASFIAGGSLRHLA